VHGTCTHTRKPSHHPMPEWLRAPHTAVDSSTFCLSVD
jgi:hypothetical protein